ncbi:MAG: oxidoreductase [Verrucomicrobiaceae bacterium]|nr:oxidoreductase [Verrucomicrobiaceae bacterium]
MKKQNQYQPPSIEFWFEFASNYSYLSVMRIEAAAALRGVNIIWKPFLLGPVFDALGWEEPPFIQQKEKGRYVWQDMQRQCRKYGLAWTQPTTFPRNSILSIRIALLGADQSWIGAYCRTIMQLNFAADRDIGNVEIISEALTLLQLPAAEIVEQAQSASNKLQLREQTAQAQAKGIFGAPTFFVRGEMFWGNDRLDDALEFAAQNSD